MGVGWMVSRRGYPAWGRATPGHDALQTVKADLFNAALVSVADTSRRSLISGCGEAAMR
jgi:hypothetical protein